MSCFSDESSCTSSGLSQWNLTHNDPSVPLRVMVMASGSGTNLGAVMDACENGRIHARVVVVASDNPDAYALTRARERGIPAVAVDPKVFPDRESHEAAILERVAPFKPQIAVLAGYMRLVTPFFLEKFKDPNTNMPGVINIHPADTKTYQGSRGYEFALGLAGKERKRLARTWITVHFVDEGMDTGPIIAQKPLDVRPDDTLGSLKARGLKVEHELYPMVIDLLAKGKVGIECQSGEVFIEKE